MSVDSKPSALSCFCCKIQVAAPSQALWEGGCCLSCPRMDEPERSAVDSSLTELTLNNGERVKTTKHIRMVSSGVIPSSGSLPLSACLGLGKGRVNLQVSAKQVLSKKPANCWPPLCHHPYPSPLSALGKSGAFPLLSLTRTRAVIGGSWRWLCTGLREAMAVVSWLGGGLCSCRSDVEGWYGPLWGWTE